MSGQSSSSLERTLAALLLVGAMVTILPYTAEAQEQESAKSWQGTWNNRKHRSNGPLKCTASRKEGNTYEAKFEGTFMGSPFDFTVPVTATAKGDRTELEGVATVDGDRYEWSGYVRGGVLFGSYRSQLGNNGEFRLQEAKN